jgi:hypothetical protein
LNLKGRGFDEMMRWEEKKDADGRRERRENVFSNQERERK